MIRIGEFSKFTHVSIRMLRFYDEQNIFKPAHVDPQSGYRFYSLSQIKELNKILFLREAGIPTNEMKAILVNWTEASIKRILEKKQIDLQQQIQKEKQKLAKLKQAVDDLNHEQLHLHTNVSIIQTPSYHVVSLRRILPTYFCEAQLWDEISQFLKQEQIEFTTCFTICHDIDFREENVDVEVCVEVKQLLEDKGDFHYSTLPAQPYMASTMVYGSFTNIAKAYRSFATWLSNHPTYMVSGCDRQFTHRGPWNETDESMYLTEIQIPLSLK